MLVYTFDRTLDGVLSAVFDAYSLRQRPDALIGEGEPLPMFCDESHRVTTTEEKARRVWKGLEKHLSREAMRMLTVSYLSEEKELDTPLFQYIYKVFQKEEVSKRERPAIGREFACQIPITRPITQRNLTSKFPTDFILEHPLSLERNFADPDVLFVTNTARRVMHERLRMMQFVRFQKAQDGTYLGVVRPDHNVLPLIIDHFRDRFQDQPWLIYDARRQYGYYYTPPLPPPLKGAGSKGGEAAPLRGAGSQEEKPSSLKESERMSGEIIRVTFEDTTSLPFDLRTGQLSEDLLSENDQLFQRLWRTYFKAICIRERMNPKKQLNDMPRRYWAYMTEKQ